MSDGASRHTIQGSGKGCRRAPRQDTAAQMLPLRLGVLSVLAIKGVAAQYHCAGLADQEHEHIFRTQVLSLPLPTAVSLSALSLLTFSLSRFSLFLPSSLSLSVSPSLPPPSAPSVPSGHSRAGPSLSPRFLHPADCCPPACLTAGSSASI